MKQLVRSVLLLILLTASADAVIPRDPDFTFRWNRFTSVVSVDSFVIAAGEDGLMVFRRSASGLALTEVSPEFINSAPLRQHRFGSVLVVQTRENLVCFYDLTSLPNLVQLGRIDLGVSITDLALRGNDLYVSRGFDGLFRYRLTDYNSAHLLDSSILGIHYLGLQISGDSLLALDDYNGVLFYHFSDTGFAKFQDYLYLPFQVSSFLKQDSLLVLALKGNQTYVARFRPDGIALTDTFDLLISPRQIMARGQTFLLFDSSAGLVETIDPLGERHGLAQLQILPDPALQGEVCAIGQKGYVLFPLRDGGLGYYDIDSLWSRAARPIFGMTPQGQVTALQIVNGKMFVGGTQNPVDEYRFGTDGAPQYERTMYSALDNVSAIDVSGDSLFVSYPQIRRSVVLQVMPDSTVYRGALYLDTMLYHSLRFNDQRIDSLRSAFTLGQSQIGMYKISDSGNVSPAGDFSVIGRILDLQIVDSIAAVSTDKGIWLFRIFDDFTTEYRTTVALDEASNDLFRLNGELALFSGPRLLRFDLTDPFRPQVDTLLQLPWGIVRATQVGRLIYAVGEEGICVVDVSTPSPVLLDSGGRGGFLIAAANGMVAISDSNRVHIYDLSEYPTPVDDHQRSLPTGFALDQNFPNPFNPSTTINYRLPSREAVQLMVYNILGQRVATLVDQTQAAGSYRVVWNGTDSGGRTLATGIYFYLLKSGSFATSKKMILLK